MVLTFCLGTLGESRAQEPLRQTEVVLIDHPDGEVLAALRYKPELVQWPQVLLSLRKPELQR